MGAGGNSNRDCGYILQTLHHIAMEFPLRRFPGSMQELHNLEGTAVPRLNGSGTWP